MGDGPLLLRLAPQRKSHGPPAQRLALALAGQDISELDVPQKRLPFGDEVVDRLVTIADATLDDDLGQALVGLLGLGNGKRNLAFLLLRFFRRRLEQSPPTTDSGSASISVGSDSSPAPPVVAHPAPISDTSTRRARITATSSEIPDHLPEGPIASGFVDGDNGNVFGAGRKIERRPAGQWLRRLAVERSGERHHVSS